MQQIIYFIRKFRYFLLFLLLEIVAVGLIVQQRSYHQSKFVNSANSISGGLYENLTSINAFFNLKEENQRLNEENVRLKNRFLREFGVAPDTTFYASDTVLYQQKYQYLNGKIVKNDYSKRNNYLTINKGTNHGVRTDMGIVNSKGVIGVVKNVSANYATVLSILNSQSKINGRLKNSAHYGSLKWDGNDPNILQLEDIPRQALIKKGDTILSGGNSAIFPAGILIGTVADFTFENNLYKEINISLFNDMTAIQYIQVIKNLQRTEQLNLEAQTENE